MPGLQSTFVVLPLSSASSGLSLPMGELGLVNSIRGGCAIHEETPNVYARRVCDRVVQEKGTVILISGSDFQQTGRLGADAVCSLESNHHHQPPVVAELHFEGSSCLYR